MTPWVETEVYILDLLTATQLVGYKLTLWRHKASVLCPEGLCPPPGVLFSGGGESVERKVIVAGVQCLLISRVAAPLINPFAAVTISVIILYPKNWTWPCLILRYFSSVGQLPIRQNLPTWNVSTVSIRTKPCCTVYGEEGMVWYGIVWFNVSLDTFRRPDVDGAPRRSV